MSNATNVVTSFGFHILSCSGIESGCNVLSNGAIHIMNRAYGWMHTCISYDFYDNSVSLDQQVVNTDASTDFFGFQSIRVSWESWAPFTFPEMFTLLNIYTRSTNTARFIKNFTHIQDFVFWQPKIFYKNLVSSFQGNRAYGLYI